MSLTLYNPHEIEAKWKKAWDEMGLYRTALSFDKPKAYCLDMFPYPSGDGLSVGHCRNYIPTDVYARVRRMQGYSVLHPMGWDAFGLPAENEALRKKVHPTQIVALHTATYKRQMNLVSLSYDWEREINSTNPKYYRWTQWFFLLLYHRGLAYRARAAQWWCPVCMTILANEQIEHGTCWRCHNPVEQKQLSQWYFKITDYAEALLNDLEQLDWPEHIVTMQRNWIGRSQGVDIFFAIEGSEIILRTFTTRPDTLFGVTFVALAPENENLEGITRPERRAQVDEILSQMQRKSSVERTGSSLGVNTGAVVIHPLTGERIPIWVADYVLESYGSGAIMGVPAHDDRDFRFAHQYGLPTKVVVASPDWQGEELEKAYEGPGRLVNSGPFTGMHSSVAQRAISEMLERTGKGRPTVRYRMRDWLISRQRYWGAPIPIVYCKHCGVIPVPEAQLPVLLPFVESYEPTGRPESPLAGIAGFVQATCPVCGGAAHRETDTLDGFACSSWYFLRFPDREYELGPFNPRLVDYWLPVDVYVGGAEQAIMHLLFSRFWVKVMYDAGLVKFREPFPRLKSQGVVLGLDGTRISKSKGNVITPDEVVEKYGADCLRLHELAMAPFEKTVAWNEHGIVGMQRFLRQVWSLVLEDVPVVSGSVDQTRLAEDNLALHRKLHQTIRKVGEDIDGFRFNTAVSALIEFANQATHYKSQYGMSETLKSTLPAFLKLLAPMAPHIAEELWHLGLGEEGSIHLQHWPEWDAELVREALLRIPVQVNGKTRAFLDVPEDTQQEKLAQMAMDHEIIRRWIEGKKVKQTIYVPGRILSIVTS